MSFKEFIQNGDVREGMPDVNLAKSLLQLAQLRSNKLFATDLNKENPFEIVERSYNVLKELADSIMAVKGYKSYSHEATIGFLKEVYSGEIGSAHIERINKYRIFRNDISYRGKLATAKDAELAVKDAQAISAILINILKKEGIN